MICWFWNSIFRELGQTSEMRKYALIQYYYAVLKSSGSGWGSKIQLELGENMIISLGRWRVNMTFIIWPDSRFSDAWGNISETWQTTALSTGLPARYCDVSPVRVAPQIHDIESMLGWCRPTVYDAVPTSIQHWFNAVRLLGTPVVQGEGWSLWIFWLDGPRWHFYQVPL